MPVDVVIPIYNARSDVRRCVESVLRHAPADCRVVLVDDASREEGLAEDLEGWARRDARVVLLRNPENQGFVRTANRGMRHAAGRDVLLLNSDTEVFAGGIEGLARCARADADTGIVTPFTNNGTIYSMPELGRDNPIPAGYRPDDLARLVASASRRRRPEMPTAVGFCMYLRAEVLAAVGLFDEEAFGRGFGEENDLCQRARRAGFRVRLCDDVFVFHKGKASFGSEGDALEHANERVLAARHPGYQAEIAAFVRSNAVEPLLAELRFHLARSRPGRPATVLHLLQGSPYVETAGGTERHVLDLVRAARLDRAAIAYPRGSCIELAEVLGGDVDHPTFYSFGLASAPQRFAIEDATTEALLARLVALFEVGGLHVHHATRWPLAALARLAGSGLATVVTAHDYYLACPSWNLFDHRRKAACDDCGAGSAPGCLRALYGVLGDERYPDPAELKAAHAEAAAGLVKAARAVVFPSASARAAFEERASAAPAHPVVLEHGFDGGDAAPRTPPGPRLRLGVLGEVAFPIKGAERLVELAAALAGDAVEWHFFGPTERFGFEERVRSAAGATPVSFHGRYEREDAVRMLREHGIDLHVSVPPWRETFSYTLSEAMVAGVATLTLADSGAIAERVGRHRAGVVARDLAEAIARIRDLSADRRGLDAWARGLEAFRHRTTAEMAADYRALYAEHGLVRPASIAVPPSELLHALYDAHEPSAPAAPSAELVQAAVPRYQRSRWYPLFLRVKRLVPASVRERGRAFLQRRELVPELTLDPARATLSGAGFRLERASGRSFSARTDGEAHLVFEAVGGSTEAIRAVRFRARRRDHRYAAATLFWTHSAGEDFSEHKSVKVVLDGRPLVWQAYVIRLDAPRLAPKWRAGAEVVRLRLDPLAGPGDLELEPIELCG